MPTACPLGDSGIPPNCVGETPTPEPTPGLTPSTTGITYYWAYEQHPVPGVGAALVNVGNGNLVLQVTDVSVAERGINLAFTRTYNSQSEHDQYNDDGSTPSVYGNGWTNNYDAHLAYNSTYNIISVYDVDGARYDYSADGDGNWIPPAGQFAQLTWDGGCGYNWTQKDGSNYHFVAPVQPASGCGITIQAGYLGRLVSISGRNVNNNVTLSYSWTSSDPSNPENLSQIVVEHSDGQDLTLSFGLINGTGPDELESITRPDGQQITYSYDSFGGLTGVDRPGNNTASSLGEAYDYATSRVGTRIVENNELADAFSPRYVFSNGSDGTDVNFAYESYNDAQVADINDTALVDFTPNDGMGINLQSQYSQYGNVPWTWRTEGFSGYGTGVTTVADTDGHARMWTVDGLWRAVQLQAYTGSEWLVSYAAWDGNNDLVATTDTRDEETDYAYDGSGNMIASAAPELTTSVGSFRPTSLYSYDGNNNVTSICDPVETNTLGDSWSSNSDFSGDSLCPASGAGIASYSWNYSDENEVYGQLTSATTPNGYTYDVQYSQSAQGGDYGLPTEVAGASAISQNDGSQRTPQESLTYDAFGNPLTIANGVGTTTATYDALHRVLTLTDADGAVTSSTYYPDGLIETSLTPSQEADSTSNGPCPTNGGCETSYDYDADGDQTSVSAWAGGYAVSRLYVYLPSAPGVVKQSYDGEDRLVEVVEPQDNMTFSELPQSVDDDLYTNPWITRYIYDLSAQGQNGSAPTFDNRQIEAYGNLYETQELLPPLSGGTAVSETQANDATPAPIANTEFQETKGTAYDALDRTTALLRYQIGGSQLEQTTMTYDAANDSVGMLTSRCNAVEQCTTYDYDARGEETRVGFSDTTPTRTMTYDPDGRTASISSSAFGTQSYFYDADGNITTSEEPSGGGVTSPATLTYHYYPDDTRSSLDVSSSALSQQGLFEYAYRTDGAQKQLVVNDSANAAVGSVTIAYTEDNAGNTTQVSESGGGGSLQDTSQCTGGSCPTGLQSTQDATSYSYDSYERLNQIGLFAGGSLYGSRTLTYGSNWDPAGNMLSNTLATSGTVTAYNDYGIDINGRILMSGNSGISSALIYYANGMAVQNMPSGGTATWDARNDVMTDNGGFEFDAAGRYVGGVSMSATYDAEDHLLGETYASTVGASSYQWGPNGLPILIGSELTGSNRFPDESLAFDTLHYDGSQVLFTTNSSGEVDDIKVGAIGDITPLDSGFTGLTIWDRDASGEVLACHNATGAAGSGVDAPWRVADKFDVLPDSVADESPCSMQGADAPGWSMAWTEYPTSPLWTQETTPEQLFTVSQVGHGGLLGMPRTDGFTDGFTTFQGVRTYDDNLGSWMEPDTYAGSAGAPESSLSFTYNSNDPLTYGDFSGHWPCAFVDAQTGNCMPGAPPDASPGAPMVPDPSACEWFSDGSYGCSGVQGGQSTGDCHPGSQACTWGCPWQCALSQAVTLGMSMNQAFCHMGGTLWACLAPYYGNPRFFVGVSAGNSETAINIQLNGCGQVSNSVSGPGTAGSSYGDIFGMSASLGYTFGNYNSDSASTDIMGTTRSGIGVGISKSEDSFTVAVQFGAEWGVQQTVPQGKPTKGFCAR